MGVSPPAPSFAVLRPALALTLTVVDKTAVDTFSPFINSSFLRNSGYLYVEGLAFETSVNDLGTFRSSVTAIKAVGVKLRDSELRRGYQYQYCKNKTNPTTEFYLKLPSLVVKVRVAFLPALLIIPCAKMAPILERTSSCLSSIIFV